MVDFGLTFDLQLSECEYVGVDCEREELTMSGWTVRECC